MTRRGLWTFLFFFLAIPSLARADFIDDAISFYNPKFVIARKAITCMADGGAFDACALKLGAGEANNALNELKKDPDFANVIALVKAVQKNDYPEVLARAGLGAACAWIEFPGKSIACSDLAGEVIAAGKEAIKLQIEMGKAVVKAIENIGSEVYSAGKAVVKSILGGGGGGGSKTTVKIDGEKIWKDCYAPNLQKAIIFRLGSTKNYIELTSLERQNGLFAQNSIAGVCFNSILKTFATAPDPSNLKGSNNPPLANLGITSKVKIPLPQQKGDEGIALQMAMAISPLRNKFTQIVENAAIKSLEEQIGNYQNLTKIYQAKPALRAKEIFTKGKPNFIEKLGETALCADDLNRTDAKAIGKWAEVSKDLGVAPIINIENQNQNWLNSAGPQPVCRDSYYPALEKEIARRFDFYSKAIAQGCMKVNNNDYHLACPPNAERAQAPSGAFPAMVKAQAMQNCVSAFLGTKGKCTEKPIGTLAPKIPLSLIIRTN